jgi:AraC family transcriptional regulator of adaptative response/methylated-DNA-[protein]-cysteine methyltransferase
MATRAAPETAALPEDEDAWKAVRDRDRARDGTFVYAVRTTGVFCRPSCPSRRPLRDNVTFFPTPADAERAGFRACARCGPTGPPAAAARAVERAAAWLEARLGERVTLAELARAVGVSPFHLQRTFRRMLGLSPRAFQEARRLDRFRRLVRGGESVGSATYGAGFGSSRGLYESARAGLGMTPAAYRRGGEREAIRFGTAATPLGRLLVARTARGVCAVSLGDGDPGLERALRAEFPRASLERDDGAMAGWLEAVATQAAGGPPAELPLDLRGTAFQLRVWQALREIPRGQSRSYGALAASLGAPRGARAVARACATNRVALLVPCHRVVAGGGGLGGYRWGASRKARLLDGEAAPPRSARRHARRRPWRARHPAARLPATHPMGAAAPCPALPGYR